MWKAICAQIFTEQIINKADLHWIKVILDRCNYYMRAGLLAERLVGDCMSCSSAYEGCRINKCMKVFYGSFSLNIFKGLRVVVPGSLGWLL